MKLAFGSLLLMVAAAVAAAVPARLPNNPIATAPEQSAPSSSVSQDPTSVSIPSSDPSGSNTPHTGPSDPVSSTDVSSTPTDTSAQTSATSVEDSSTKATSLTSSTDSLTSTGDAPTITPGQRATTSDVASVTSSDVPPPSQTSSSSSSTAPSQPTTTPPTVDKQTYLDQHNQWRAKAGAADLQWSDDLAAKAQSYAEQCQLKHSNGALGQVGENLVAATGSFDADDAMTLFVQDRRNFDPADLNLSHFTQVIWSSTSQLGCGVATCNGIFPDRGDATYHVCLYDPVGNVVGEEMLNLPHFG
ncbi:CAP domain-containing protein [Ganoderma leucocontextum]|nr:CAP domain-containing protein [Ganoderma leucocontextum]